LSCQQHHRIAAGNQASLSKPKENGISMASDSDPSAQDEIESLLNQANSGEPPAAPTNPPENSGDTSLGPDEIETLLGTTTESSDSPGSDATGPSAKSPDGGAKSLDQDDFEALLKQSGEGAAAENARRQTQPQAGTAAPTATGYTEEGIPPQDIEYLFNQAEGALASIDHPSQDIPSGIKPFSLEEFRGAPASTETATLDLIRDVDLDVKIELGRTQMHLAEVLKLRKGSVVPLDKLAGDPVDVYVNGRLVARGEVLVLNDNFCVRVAELLAGDSTPTS
jgi:flagellar motor switch protein FliN/FliY